jgi:ABC-type multidrug transport system fused ATPase/permease subunit
MSRLKFANDLKLMLRNCERLLVMKYRKIIEDGSFDQLMTGAGLFRAMIEKNRFNLPQSTASAA